MAKIDKDLLGFIGAADVNPYKTRFADAPWFYEAQDKYSLVLGSGGIGSNLIFLLSSIGVSMSIYDVDVCDTVNLGAQHFRIKDLNKPKVEAISEVCREFLGNDNDIETNNCRYDKDSPANPVTFLAFDNMASRKLAYEKWVELLESTPENERDQFILIDGRLLAETYQIYTVTKDNYLKYKESLLEDSEVEDEPCTMKATRFASWGIVSDMVAVFLNWCTNLAYEDEIREVPYFITKVYNSFYYKAV